MNDDDEYLTKLIDVFFGEPDRPYDWAKEEEDQ